LPPINLLREGNVRRSGRRRAEGPRAAIEEKCLEFDVQGRVTQINPGPVVTRSSSSRRRESVSRIIGLTEDLCLRYSGVILIERIPGCHNRIRKAAMLTGNTFAAAPNSSIPESAKFKIDSAVAPGTVFRQTDNPAVLDSRLRLELERGHTGGIDLRTRPVRRIPAFSSIARARSFSPSSSSFSNVPLRAAD